MGYYLLGEKIIEQMKQVKEERRFLERIREELIKKIEKLFEQSKLKRYHGKVYYIFFLLHLLSLACFTEGFLNLSSNIFYN